MLSSISSYFNPLSIRTNSFDQALSKSTLTSDEVRSLLDQGLDPALKDELGFSAIDYAIFDGQTKKLPLLFQQPISTKYIRPQMSSSLEQISNLKVMQQIAKLVVKIGDTDLDQSDSPNAILLEEFLNLNWDKNQSFKSYEISPIHMLALFAKPGVLQHVIAKHPQWLEIRDKKGNTPLHYAALNQDEHLFALLAKQGADIFALNANKVTAIGEFVCRIQARDPLQWNYRDLIVFMSSWLPTALDFAAKSGYLNHEVYQLLEQVLPQIRFIGSLTQLSTIFSSIQSNPKKAFFALAFLVTSWIPVINLPYKAYVTYSLAQRAFDALKQGYYHFNRKPLTASVMGVVKTANALEYAQGLYQDCVNAYSTVKITQLFYNTYSMITSKWQEYTQAIEKECGQEALEALQQEPENMFKELSTGFSFNKYPTYRSDDDSIKFKLEDQMNCALNQFESTYKEMLDQESASFNPDFQSFYSQVINPFLKSYSSTCLESAMQLGHRFECLYLVGEDLLSRYFNIHQSEGSSNAGFNPFETMQNDQICTTALDKAFEKHSTSAHQMAQLSLAERLKILPHPEVSPQNGMGRNIQCLNIALDIFGMSGICDKNDRGRPLYADLYKKLSREMHPDRNKEEGANEVFAKIGAAKEILQKEYEHRC